MRKGLPNEYVPNADKFDPEFGKKVAKALTDTGGDYDNLVERQIRFFQNRRLAEGQQDPEIYKELSGDHKGLNDFKNMFWNVINPLPKYITNATDILTEGKYKPQASAFDKISMGEKNDQKAKLIANLILKNAEETIFKDMDISLVDKGEKVPASMDEIKIHETRMKSSIEMISEMGASVVLENNKFERIRSRTAKELAVNKWGVREVYLDEYGDIKIAFARASKALVPYSEDDFFEHRKYTGIIRDMTIAEIWVMNESKENPPYTRDDIFQLARKVAGERGNPSWETNFDQNDHNQRYNTYTLEVLSFEFNTTISHDYASMERKSGGKFYKKIKEEEKGNKGKKGKYDKKKYTKNSKQRQVYFDGLYVLGSDKILEWKLRENMAQNGDGLYDSKPHSRFIVVAPGIEDMKNRSIAEAAEPYLHQLQLIWLKKQLLISKITPPKIQIDLDAQDNIVQGLGIKGGNAMDVARVMEQIGLIYIRGKQSGLQAPIKEIPTYIHNEIRALFEASDQILRELENEIGLNDVLVGSNDNRYEGLGSRDRKIASAIRSLSGLQDALDYMDDTTLQIVDSMIKQALVRGDHRLVKGFEKAIGKLNVDILKIAKHETLAESGIKFKMLPNKDEVARIEMNIQREIDNQQMNVEDGEEIIELAKEFPKQARMLASIKREEYRKKRMEEAQANAQANGQTQQQSIAVKAEADRQKAADDFNFKTQMAELTSFLKRQEAKEQVVNDIAVDEANSENKIEQIEAANANNLQNTTSGNSEIRQPSVFAG